LSRNTTFSLKFATQRILTAKNNRLFRHQHRRAQ